MVLKEFIGWEKISKERKTKIRKTGNKIKFGILSICIEFSIYDTDFFLNNVKKYWGTNKRNLVHLRSHDLGYVLGWFEKKEDRQLVGIGWKTVTSLLFFLFFPPFFF